MLLFTDPHQEPHLRHSHLAVDGYLGQVHQQGAGQEGRHGFPMGQQHGRQEDGRALYRASIIDPGDAALLHKVLVH